MKINPTYSIFLQVYNWFLTNLIYVEAFLWSWFHMEYSVIINDKVAKAFNVLKKSTNYSKRKTKQIKFSSQQV